MTVVNLEKKSTVEERSDNRLNLVKALEANKWKMDTEYDYDAEREIPADYSWHILTKDGYRTFKFGLDDYVSDFTFIQVIDYVNRPNDEWVEGFKSIRTNQFQIGIEYVKEICIEDHRIIINLNLPGLVENKVVFY